MRTPKKAQRVTQKKGPSWISRHFGSIIFSTLVFSSVVYALSWPSIPGEAGYPIEGSFWNIFEKILVDTGGTNDGTVKKSEKLGIHGENIAIVANSGGHIGVGGTGADTSYTMSVSGQALFADNVIGTTPTASGHFATKGYVDAQVVSAGGGGYGMCYRIRNTSASYPTCAAGFTRAYAAYGQLVDNVYPTSDTYNIYFENSIGGAWFQNYGHVYFYFERFGPYNNQYKIIDDQDLVLVYINGWSNDGVIGNYSQVFSSTDSTYLSYTTVSPTTFINTQLAGTPAFGYAVCCK